MGRRTLGRPTPGRRINHVHIESVDLEGQGVAHLPEGKVAFVAGALAGELVDLQVLRERPSYVKAQAVAWHKASADRVQPGCPHFGVCGGCSMQHASGSAQIAIKQRALEDALWHLGRLRPAEVISPMRGPEWGYRSRARLSVRWVDKKGGLLVGFREKGSSYVAQMTQCPVLVPQANALLPALRDMIASLSIAREIPQAELAAGEPTQVWVLRNLAAPSEQDLATLRRFAREHGVQVWLQPQGPATASPIDGQPELPALAYRLPAHGLTMPFSPVDFTQVNFGINRALVSRALALLDLQPHHRVADFFCGLGNFTLPLARACREVLGLEGSVPLVEQAQRNAQALGVGHVRYECRNLFEFSLQDLQNLGPLERVLLDPPREGAQSVCEALAAASTTPGAHCPERLVMVSCNPATLARDAAILVHQGQWRLAQAGVVNMFPQTAHVESIAVFTRDHRQRSSSAERADC